jgi:hypothetical protein
MARIPVEVVERLKAEVSVQRLAEARGVTFKKHGSDLIGRWLACSSTAASPGASRLRSMPVAATSRPTES